MRRNAGSVSTVVHHSCIVNEFNTLRVWGVSRKNEDSKSALKGKSTWAHAGRTNVDPHPRNRRANSQLIVTVYESEGCPRQGRQCRKAG